MSNWRVVNEAPRPRVLIMLSETVADRFDFLRTRPGTVRQISNLNEVDPGEWDAIITDDALARHSEMDGNPYAWWRRNVPLGLHVFLVHRATMGSTIDLVVASAEDAQPSLVIKHVFGVPGNAALRIDKLDFELQRLTQKVLVPVVTGRSYQWGHQPEDVTPEKAFKMQTYVPFLIGASTTVIAGHYRRAPAESVWLIPTDVPDFEPWWDMAIEEWHELTPDRIPGLPQWQRSVDWMSATEQVLAEKLNAERNAFVEAEARHHESVATLEAGLAEVNALVDSNERILLTGQGDDLQAAVTVALLEIGFQVEDMDAVWDPRERREDYRIRDHDAPEWMVIADATGTNGGTPGAKLQTLSTYVNKYMLEEKPDSIPGQWLLSNQFIGRDPILRVEVLRGDDLRAFAAAGGLAIDTAALFVLQRAAIAADSLKPRMRSWLRGSTGQIRLSDARAWLDASS